MHSVIIIPGLGDDTKKLQFATRNWHKKGLIPIVQAFGWSDNSESYEIKQEKLLELTDAKLQESTISLIGTSAGASAAINAFSLRQEKINGVVNVCGRLRKGSDNGYRSLELKSKHSPSFRESVLLCERNINIIEKQNLKRIMTIRPAFGDELVPANTVPIDGAVNITIPTGEHLFSISMAMTVFSNRIISFLKGLEEHK